MPSDRLSMLALGIRGDQPVDAERPPLVDGIHLRWVFDYDVGFPWGGFYLFRRESAPTQYVCLKPQLERFKPGATQTTQIKTRVGQLSSPKPLVFTDNFAPAGAVEADLRAPLRFDLPPGVTTHVADIRIGFPPGDVTRTCVDFRQMPLGSGPNPRTENGAVFTIEPLLTLPTAESSIAEVSGSPHGLEGVSRFETSVRINAALPCSATRVDLILTNPTTVTVEGFDDAGSSVGIQTFAANALSAGAVRISGTAIKRVTIQSAGAESALLHEICWECPGAAPPPGPKTDIRFDDWPIEDKGFQFVEQGVLFEIDNTTSPMPTFAKNANGMTGVQGTVIITLPCSTTSVSMLFSNSSVMAHVDALNQDGTPAQEAEVAPGANVINIVLSGTAINSLNVHGYRGTLLHHLSFQCLGTTGTKIDITGTAGSVEVARASATGAPGQIVRAVLSSHSATGFDGITFSAGNAALVELCYFPDGLTDTFGWEVVPQFQYPLSLPVADADYPPPSKPATPSDAETLAHSRVTYQAPPGWDQQFLPQLHDELVALVHGGPQPPNGGPMATREHSVLAGQPLSPATQESPSMPNLRPLELVLLASLHPAMAQMLGLYFADQTVQPYIPYDYLLLADRNNVLGGTADSALDWIAFDTDRHPVDTARADSVMSAERPPIAPPGAPRAYALPTMAVRRIDGSMDNGIGAAGLSWDLPPDSNQPDPDRIIFYYPRRISLGTATPAAQPAPGDYNVRLQPILISEPDPANPPVTPQRSSDWPPPSVPLYLVDGNLPEGWYSYALSGQDLFGRRSALGPPSEWYQWDPLQSVHPYAVALWDKIPPSPPLGIEAWALDPLDRWVLKDQAYDHWRASVPADRVGLRVRWRWTFMQQLQAPDTAEFRIYYQPGRWNALLGNVDAVTPASATQSYVDLDFADSRAVDAFAGTRLRVGNNDFAVIGSQPGAKLRLRVQNIGAQDEITPAAGTPCTIAIPEGHALFVDTGVPSSWARRLLHVPYDPPTNTAFDVAVNDTAATAVINGATIQLSASVDLSGIQPWIDHIRLNGANYPIVRFDNQLHTVTLGTAPPVSSPQAWAIGRPAREYDVFLDAPDVGTGNVFEPSLAEPTVFAQIAVSAADDKVHVADTFPGGNRFGNESHLSPSATVYRVLQKPPDAPQLPALGDRLYATPADYHNRSYSTFRFFAAANLRIHVLRALDDSLFQRDWLIRETRTALDPATHADFFPGGMSDADRATAAAKLNAITPATDYTTLPQSALDVLALLPGNEHASDLATRDKAIRASLATVTVASPTAYAGLSDADLRALAGLPGNDAAFTQVTLNPFEMSDPTIADSRRPDDADGYTPQPTVRAYTDTLPGRATNRYFYRALFVDGAQNQSALSMPGPPVYLRKVEPPRAPVITQVIGGDRQITIRWIGDSTGDVAQYQIYRTTSEASASDIRRMDLQTVVSPPALTWTDTPVPAGSTFFYRVAAMSLVGERALSTVITARAFDDSRPAAPQWLSTMTDPLTGEVMLQWSAASMDLMCRVERSQAGLGDWSGLTGWLAPGQYSTADVNREVGVQYDYRIRAINSSGRISPVSTVVTV